MLSRNHDAMPDPLGDGKLWEGHGPLLFAGSAERQEGVFPVFNAGTLGNRMNIDGDC